MDTLTMHQIRQAAIVIPLNLAAVAASLWTLDRFGPLTKTALWVSIGIGVLVELIALHISDRIWLQRLQYPKARRSWFAEWM